MATLTIDGREYPMPDLGELTMGQARTLKRYTGMTLEEVSKASAVDPDIIAAYCHLAIAEAEPDLSFAAIEKQVNAIKFAQLDIKADEKDEDDERPPASTQNENVSELPRSGPTSPESSDAHQETSPSRTGTVDSATGPTLAQVTSLS